MRPTPCQACSWCWVEVYRFLISLANGCPRAGPAFSLRAGKLLSRVCPSGNVSTRDRDPETTSDSLPRQLGVSRFRGGVGTPGKPPLYSARPLKPCFLAFVSFNVLIISLPKLAFPSRVITFANCSKRPLRKKSNVSPLYVKCGW